MARRFLMDRRSFLRAAGLGFAGVLTLREQAAFAATDAVYAAAFARRDGGYGVAILAESGEVLHELPLPERGHDVTFHAETGRCVIFARQPGTFAVVFERNGGAEPVTLTAAAGRHFYGHGAFSSDGRLLYAAENDYDGVRGMVGIYDATDGYRRLGEFPTHGIGPHEILLLDDGKTLAVANGGIETHPDFGRAKLNIATMRPSLVFLDARDGRLIEQHALPPALHQLSIRHMDLTDDGWIWFGCQHEGPASETPQLAGRVRPGSELILADMPRDALVGLRNYVGSVATNRKAGTVALTSPQGNSLAILDASSGRLVASRGLTEVCGIAAEAGDFLASTGTGRMVHGDGREQLTKAYVWDNHITRFA